MSLLYQMIIGPLEIFFEVIYQLSYGILGNAGLAVIPVSLVINLLCLPLYLRADAIQKGNREKENSMAPYIDHIKKHFSGAEQYMMLQTYYRIENYKPLHVLRNAFSLLIQIPFFIAAYNFLSNLEIMQGTPLGPISDLSKPDSLLVIGGLSINILPILMTVVNILSGAVYSKKMSVQDKVQLYGVAIFFLILLYQSPAGLVFYWLLNNIFSLLKNIVISSISVSNFVKKIKNCQPFFKKVNKYLLFALFLIGCLMLLTGIVFLKLSGELNIKLISIGLLLQLPIIFNFVVKRLKKNNVLENDRAIFVTTCLFMVLLTGVLIPSAVISSSPTEFITISDYQSPLYHIFNSFLLALGTFVFWPSVFYYFSNSKVRQVFEFVLICISGLAIINYMVFETNLGVLSPVLQYKVQPNFSPFLTNINISICLVTTLILLVLYIKKINFVKILFRIMLLVLLGMSINNIIIINSKLPTEATIKSALDKRPTLNFSQSGKNVVVLVLDRAISGFIPYMFNEKPELKRQFEGFVWYPNTITHGNSTNSGTPGIYGGYEYTPEEMNRRKNEKLVDKHNEALKLMPTLFDKAGYSVTVYDPPCAGYKNIPDLSIYDDTPNVKAYLTERGVVRSLSPEYLEGKKQLWKRNFFCYSIMKISPVVLQKSIYRDGTYFYSNATAFMQINLGDGSNKLKGTQEEFMNAYAVLKQLPEMTSVSEVKGAFMVVYNLTSHEPILLQEPDYTPEVHVNNTEYDSVHAGRFNLNGRILHTEHYMQISHYHANMAAMIQLGKWFDYLRSQGLYNNTRIIIVADHGSSIGCFDDMLKFFSNKTSKITFDVMFFNPLFMVKDFNNNNEFAENSTFMTNADTPTLAFLGLLKDPINPFTGNLITNKTKNLKEQHVLAPTDWQLDENNNRNTFLPGFWFSLRNQNIFEMDNWKYIGHY